MTDYPNPGNFMGHPRTVFVTQAQAAARWGVHVDTIRRLVAAGKVTGYRLNRRVIRVSVAEVDACFRPIPVRQGRVTNVNEG